MPKISHSLSLKGHQPGDMGSVDNVKHYDLVVLGSGEAGKYIAWTEAPKGKRCAVIERRWLGGSCPNVACLPSKNVIHSAKLLHSHGNRLDQCYKTENEPKEESANMLMVKKRKDDMVEGLRVTHQGNSRQMASMNLGRWQIHWSEANRSD